MLKGANVFQGTLQHGLTDRLDGVWRRQSLPTVMSRGKIGIALNMSIGAFSLDGATSQYQGG